MAKLFCIAFGIMMQSAYFLSALVAIGVTTNSVFAQSPASGTVKLTPWVEFGGFASTERSRTEAAFWLPLAQSSTSVLFADARGKLFEEDQREGNLALGYRQMAAGQWNIGGWLGFDRRQTKFGSYFNQIALGVEALHPTWEFRLNAYIPTENDRTVAQTQTVATSASASTTTAQLTGGNILLVTDTLVTSTTSSFQLRELALRGLDVEVGYTLPVDWTAIAPGMPEVRLYAGAFAFEHLDFERNITGPKLRAELRFKDFIPSWSGSRLALEGSHRWDDVRGHHQEAGIRLRLPLSIDGQSASYAGVTAREQRMMEAVHRDTDIVTQSKITASTTATANSVRTTEKVADVATGVTFERAAVVSNGSNLQSVLNTLGGNSLVIVQGGAASFGQAVLQSGQTLQGGGSTIQLRGTLSGIVVDYVAPGSRPLLQYAGNANVVVAASNTHVVGLDVKGGGGQNVAVAGNGGIVGGDTAPFGTAGLFNIVIENNNISNIGQRGISFGGNNSDIVVRNNTINDVAEVGIGFYHVNLNINISNNTVVNTGYGSIGLGDNSTNITIAGNSMANAGFLHGGLQISANSKNVVISANVFSGSMGQKMIDFQGSGSEIVTAKSFGNVDLVTQVFGSKCVSNSATAFSGSVSFTSGLVFTDNVAPCN